MSNKVKLIYDGPFLEGHVTDRTGREIPFRKGEVCEFHQFTADQLLEQDPKAWLPARKAAPEKTSTTPEATNPQPK